MPMPPQGMEQETDDKTSKPMEWQNVLFFQINRIMQAWTEQKGDFMAGIEALDTALAFFKTNDKRFAADLKEIDEQAEKEIKKLQTYGGRVPAADMNAVSYARSKLRLEALLRLMGRCGFYPEQQRDWTEKE